MEDKIPLEERVAVLRANKLDEYKLTRIAELRDRQDRLAEEFNRDNERLEEEIKSVMETKVLPSHIEYKPSRSGLTISGGGLASTFASLSSV